MDSVKLQGKGSHENLLLREGDGTYIFVGQKGASFAVENTGDRVAEILVFDVE